MDQCVSKDQCLVLARHHKVLVSTVKDNYEPAYTILIFTVVWVIMPRSCALFPLSFTICCLSLTSWRAKILVAD
jgi:hypothetical protein